QNVFEDLVEIAYSMGLADHIRMNRNAHQPSIDGAFNVQSVELPHATLCEVVRFEVPTQHWYVVELAGVRDAEEASVPHVDGYRVVVDLPVRLIHESSLGEEVGSALGVASGRTGLPENLPTAGQNTEVGTDCVIEGALLVLIEACDGAGVVETVVDEDPIASEHRLADFGKLRQDRQVERRRASDLVSVEDFEHSPRTHTSPVVAQGVLLYIGLGHARRPRRMGLRGDVLVVLDVRRDP